MLMANDNLWEYICSKCKELDFLINVSIPAAAKRDEPISPVITVCSYPRLRKLITEKICGSFPEDGVVCGVTSITPGDTAAVLSELKTNSLLYVENGVVLNRMQSSALELLVDAIKHYRIEFIIGKGSASKTYSLDMPPFSFVAIFESRQQIPAALKTGIENRIEIDSFSDCELCSMEIKALADEYGISFDNEAIKRIAESAKGNWRQAGKIVRWIRDYALVKNDVCEPFGKEYIEKVIGMMC